MGNQDIEIEPNSNKDIMFGIVDCNRDLFVKNILLIAKKYFNSCRCNKTILKTNAIIILHCACRYNVKTDQYWVISVKRSTVYYMCMYL